MKQKQPSAERIFHALGDSTRRAMLERLSAGPMSVSQLAQPFRMSLAAVVQHLQVLEEAGLVRTEKTGRVRSCRVENAGIEAAINWLNARRPEWARRFDRLEEMFAADDADKSKK